MASTSMATARRQSKPNNFRARHTGILNARAACIGCIDTIPDHRCALVTFLQSANVITLVLMHLVGPRFC